MREEEKASHSVTLAGMKKGLCVVFAVQSRFKLLLHSSLGGQTIDNLFLSPSTTSETASASGISRSGASYLQSVIALSSISNAEDAGKDTSTPSKGEHTLLRYHDLERRILTILSLSSSVSYAFDLHSRHHNHPLGTLQGPLASPSQYQRYEQLSSAAEASFATDQHAKLADSLQKHEFRPPFPTTSPSAVHISYGRTDRNRCRDRAQDHCLERVSRWNSIVVLEFLTLHSSRSKRRRFDSLHQNG